MSSDLTDTQILNPKPQTLNHKPQSLNPKPYTVAITQRTQCPLIKEYTLNYRGLKHYDLRYSSLIKGYWVLWEAPKL